MPDKFSILIILGNKVRSYTISKLTAQILACLFIAILGGAGWLIFQYGSICQKSFAIRSLKHENQELRKKYKKLQTFQKEFNDFKLQTIKIANLLGVENLPQTPSSQISVSFSPKDSFPSLKSLTPQDELPNTPSPEDPFIPSIFPVKGIITQKFSSHHPGVDFAAELGTPVFSTMQGTAQFVGFNDTLGNIVEISNQRGFKTLYAHLEKITIPEGLNVRCGDLIGFVGSTGKSSAPHLHYEIKLNEIPQNPEKYLPELEISHPLNRRFYEGTER